MLYTGKILRSNIVQGYVSLSEESLQDILANQLSIPIEHNGVIVGYTTKIEKDGDDVSISFEINSSLLKGDIQ